MTTFGSVYSNSLGATQLVRLLEQDARRRAFQAPPEEREHHFEQANKFRDMLFAHNFLRSFMLG